jgi:YHS domain-containing protein
MTEPSAVTESALDPICGKTIDPSQSKHSSKDEKGVHYFCSEACQRQYDAADKKEKKGIWARYTERLKNTHCTRTPPECR